MNPILFTLVSPLYAIGALLYGSIIGLRNFMYNSFPVMTYKSRFPSISIGSIHAGGSGKTPLTVLIGRYFLNKEIKTGVLSRGYKRQIKNHTVLHPTQPTTWEESGDEPTLIRSELSYAWIGVGGNRVKNIKYMEKFIDTREKTVLLLDDGFQHRRVPRNLDILCLHKDSLSDKLIPQGQLREPIKNIARASIICLIGSDEEKEILGTLKAKLEQDFQKEVFILFQQPGHWFNLFRRGPSDELPLKSPICISGIAKPERFLKMIADKGVLPVKEYVFDDHHVFTPEDFESMPDILEHGIVTTQKDAMRLKTFPFQKRPHIWYLSLDLQFEDMQSESRFYSLCNDSIT